MRDLDDQRTVSRKTMFCRVPLAMNVTDQSIDPKLIKEKRDTVVDSYLEWLISFDSNIITVDGQNPAPIGMEEILRMA